DIQKSPSTKENLKKEFGINEEQERKIQNFKKVSLTDVVLETVSNSYNIKVAREKVRQTKISLDDAYSGYKPTLDLEYTYGSNRVTPGDEGKETGTHSYADENLKVLLKQNIYAGGATEYKIKALTESLQVSKSRYELAISQEIQNAIKAYFGVVFSFQSSTVTKTNMEMLRKILEIVTIKYELGAASIGDISSIKASVANAESKLSQTNSKFVEALKYYEYIVGENFKYTLPYEYEYDIKIDSLEELLKKANEGNLNIVSYLLSVKSEEYKLKGNESGFKPKVDLFFTYMRTFDKDTIDREFYEQDTSQVFLSVKYNLYNGDKDSNAIISAYSAIRELQYKIEEERRKVKWIISNVFQSLNALDGTINSIKQEVESSKVMVESYWEAFQNGEQDLQTLLIAQRQLNAAQVSLIESYENRVNNYFKLLFETGELVSFFELDPTKENFIDFTKSKYNNNYSKDTQLAKEYTDFMTLNIEADQITVEKEVQTIDTLEDILMFKDMFLDANDSDFTIFISSFESVYETFSFMQENNATKHAFIVDMIEGDKLKNAIAYGIYSSFEHANEVLGTVKKAQDKKYEVVPITKIKELYKKFLDSLSELQPKEAVPQKEIIKTKIIKLVPKEPQPYFTNEEFKQEFMRADESIFTINLATFTKLDDAIILLDKEKISNKAFVFKYGTNAEWIKVLYGVFATYEQAQAGLASLSAKTKENYFPIIENIKDKQELYKKYNHLKLGTPLSSFGKTEYRQMPEDEETKEQLKQKNMQVNED
ncbi:MAG: TolC family protein, partial [Sulfurimonas sp.]|nr:TolC family protein [Sulfurimonas sp.]